MPMEAEAPCRIVNGAARCGCGGPVGAFSSTVSCRGLCFGRTSGHTKPGRSCDCATRPPTTPFPGNNDIVCLSFVCWHLRKLQHGLMGFTIAPQPEMSRLGWHSKLQTQATGASPTTNFISACKSTPCILLRGGSDPHRSPCYCRHLRARKPRYRELLIAAVAGAALPTA